MVNDINARAIEALWNAQSFTIGEMRTLESLLASPMTNAHEDPAFQAMRREQALLFPNPLDIAAALTNQAKSRTSAENIADVLMALAAAGMRNVTPVAPGAAIAAREQDYPPLPEAPIIGTSRFGSIFRGHSDAAMRAYVDADRAARKPLTDEQITDAIESHFSETHEWPEGDIEIARVIERAHGIKE